MRRRYFSTVLLLLWVFEILRPTLLMGMVMNGGPTQPESSSFTPAGASEMVDPFTGNFSYNIPLLEADGYPLNLSYSAGITPSSEATWVGLGWSLNPGAVTRDVRGIPDDFDGDIITYRKNIRNNTTVGVTGGIGGEIVGMPIGLSLSGGLSFNNYRGFDLTTNAGLTFGGGESAKGPFNAGLSISNSSMNGLTLSPRVGLRFTMSELENKDSKLASSSGLTLSSSYNSRVGVKQIQFGANLGLKAVENIVGSVGTASAFGTINTGYALPRVNSDFKMVSYSARFTLPVEIFLAEGHAFVNGFFSKQTLQNKVQSKRAFGYLNSHKALDANSDIMDYTRENENGFNYEMPALPMSRNTPDILTINGQGVSGSYQPYYNSIGNIRESIGRTKNADYSLGIEVGGGNIFKAGDNIQMNKIEAYSGPWVDGNEAIQGLGFRGPEASSSYENVYFAQAGDMGEYVNSAYFHSTGADKAVRFTLQSNSSFEHKSTSSLKGNDNFPYLASNYLFGPRVKRNKPLSVLTVGEVLGGGAKTSIHTSDAWSSYADYSKSHHMGEITAIGENGQRHVFGLPVYNAQTYDATFSVGTRLNGQSFPYQPSCIDGTIQYNPGSDDTMSNSWGTDNYFNSESTPAYAHSYLPTAILGKNYIDSDGEPGVTTGDFGEWVLFSYKKLEDLYKWRSPFQENRANFNEGIRTDKTDNKASYSYGEREVVYVDKIETRNYVISFHTSGRDDGYGVKNRNGGIDLNGCQLQKLDSIHMYTRLEFENSETPVPTKSVHFEYDYSLSPGVPYNSQSNGGKLTLKRVYFTHEGSDRGTFNPYIFSYDNNMPHDLKGVDRWGYPALYEPDDISCPLHDSDELLPAYFPFVEQDEANANTVAGMWNLTSIALPNGGKIEVEYEADRYRYVQHKEATIMKKLHSANLKPTTPAQGEILLTNIPASNGSADNLVVTIQSDGYEASDFVSPGELVYFRTLVQIGQENEDRTDFITGYAKVESATKIGDLIHIEFEDTNLDGFGSTNPFLAAALQFSRLHLPHIVYNTPLINTDAGLGLQLLEALINSAWNLGNMFTSPNLQILQNWRCQKFYTDKTWIKVKNPTRSKFGGGHRVKEIRHFDMWHEMTSGEEDKVLVYKTNYSYLTEEGECSGVASNEPLFGMEENSLVSPRFFSEKNLLAPDNRYYVDMPYAMSFFPAANVGYSRVVVKETTMVDGQEKDPKVGFVEHEFYTAKEFPTIHETTDLKHIHDKSPQVSFQKLFGNEIQDFITFSQGFMVETNDMHGKPKRVARFPTSSEASPGNGSPNEYTEYHYKSDLITWQNDPNARRLSNDFNTVVSKNGTVSSKPIGIYYDVTVDSKAETSSSELFAVSGNVDASMAIFVPLIIPTGWPKTSSEITEFKYVTVTKSIQKFGILESVVNYKNGTLSKASNLAYDAETGRVLLTKTQNNFNDPVYDMSYPAYWGVPGMGPAYENIGFEVSGISILSNGTVYGVSPSVMKDGDEVILRNGSTYTSAWVVNNPNVGFRIIDANGDFPTGFYSEMKVVRSGARNQLNDDMMVLKLIDDPLNDISSNIYKDVISGSGVQYGNSWKTICNCFGPDNVASNMNTTNPFVTGARGQWRPLASYVSLANRSQTDYNENTDIRKDGTLLSFTPLYIKEGSKWNLNTMDWTTKETVTEFSPEGYALESRDALGRHSALQYGYNRALKTAEAFNAERREMGFDGFEDSEYACCGTDHFRLTSEAVSGVAHTGKRSALVQGGSPITNSFDLQPCAPLVDISCNLISTWGEFNGSYYLEIECFAPPLDVEYEIIDGEPIVELTSNGLVVSDPIGSGFTIEVTIGDAENCFYNTTIEEDIEN